jgi:hypothetical protein
MFMVDGNGAYNMSAVTFVQKLPKTGMARLHFAAGSFADTASAYEHVVSTLQMPTAAQEVIAAKPHAPA